MDRWRYLHTLAAGFIHNYKFSYRKYSVFSYNYMKPVLSSFALYYLEDRQI